MSKILFLYSTVDGHTLKICRRLQQVVEQGGHEATLADLENPRGIELESFDAIVVGASIRYGKHRPQVAEFMRVNREMLERKPNKNTPETNPYVRKFLRQIGWRPRLTAVFAGMLDYPRYGFWDRQVIRFIMLLTKGPTDPKSVVEFTDWRQVESVGRQISEMR